MMREDPTINSMLNDKIDSLSHALESVEKRMGERLTIQDTQLARIETKVDTTNGRVTVLERARERAQGVIFAFSWIPPILTAVFTAGLTILVMALTGSIR